MSRPTIKTLLSASTLLLGAVFFTPSCADNNSSIFIVGVVDVNQSSCIAKPDNTGPFLASGTLDTVFASGYTAVLVVGNQMTEEGSMEDLRTETSRVSLRGAEVTLSTLDGKPLAVAGAQSTFSTVGTGFVDPAAGNAPSYATMAVQIVPPGLNLAPQQILSKVRVFGETLGGTSVTSSEIDFPITICEGCLINFDTPDTTQAAGSSFMCATSAASTTQTAAVPPCLTGQDKSFSCTLCSAAYAQCKDPCQLTMYKSSSTCTGNP